MDAIMDSDVEGTAEGKAEVYSASSFLLQLRREEHSVPVFAERSAGLHCDL